LGGRLALHHIESLRLWRGDEHEFDNGAAPHALFHPNLVRGVRLNVLGQQVYFNLLLFHYSGNE
jgi:hypothetical protein